MPKAVTACQRRRDNFSLPASPGQRRSAPADFRVEQQLLAVIETLRTEVDSLKLSLGRERRV